MKDLSFSTTDRYTLDVSIVSIAIVAPPAIAYQQLEQFYLANKAVSKSLEILANADKIKSLDHSIIFAQVLTTK